MLCASSTYSPLQAKGCSWATPAPSDPSGPGADPSAQCGEGHWRVKADHPFPHYTYSQPTPTLHLSALGSGVPPEA